MRFQKDVVIRFMAIEWDGTSLLIEPVFRYSTELSAEELIDDIALDIALDIQSDTETAEEYQVPETVHIEPLRDAGFRENIYCGADVPYLVKTKHIEFVSDENEEIQPV